MIKEFFRQCQDQGDAPALRYFVPSKQEWKDISWKDYARWVCVCAAYMRAKGVGPGDRVVIWGPNTPQWVIADYAIMSLGAISVPVYANAAQKDIDYIMDHADPKMICLGTTDGASRLSAKDRSKVFFMQPSDEGSHWGELQKMTPLKVEELIEHDPESICSIIYTSGTTGEPKGVIHTHGNFALVRKVMLKEVRNHEQHEFISYLPLSHVAERTLVQILAIGVGARTTFARSIETLGEDLLAIRPTVLLAVPRVWEKMHEKIMVGVRNAPLIKRIVFSMALFWGGCRIVKGMIVRGRGDLLGAKLSDLLVGNQLRAKLGLDRLKMALTGSAATPIPVTHFFASFGILIREIYGMTENMCMGTLNEEDVIRPLTCGRPFSANEVRIAEDGEVLMKAPYMFKGYYRNEEATREAFTPDGWYRTGDLGEFDEEGQLKLKGRKKELIKTSGGKYVTPIPIEEKIKNNLLVGDAMVIGEGRKYCTALISLDAEFAEGMSEKEIHARLKDTLEDTNIGQASFESIKRLGVLRDGFSIEAGTLTPSLKVKRNAVLKHHAEFIDSMYQGAGSVIFEKEPFEKAG